MDVESIHARACAGAVKFTHLIIALLTFGTGAVPILSCSVADQNRRADEREIEQLIKDLASDQFPLRDQAARRLSAFGKAALPYLRRVANSEDPDLARRAKEIIAEVEARSIRPPLVQIAAFSPDVRHLAINNTDVKPSTLWVRDVETGRDLVYLRSHPLRVGFPAFSPDGTLFLCPGFRPAEHELHRGDYSIWVFDWRQDKVIARLKGHTEGVSAAVFLPDGQHVLSASLDRTLRVWGVKTEKEIRKFQAHDDWITRLSLSPDGKRALTGSRDRTMRLWDVETGKELRKWVFEVNVLNTLFSPDGKQALSTSGRLYWDGKISGIEGGAVRLWDLATGRQVGSFGGEHALVHSTAFSRDGQLIAVGDCNSGVAVWQRQPPMPVATFRAKRQQVVALAFTPDGRKLHGVTEDGALETWEIPARR